MARVYFGLDVYLIFRRDLICKIEIFNFRNLWIKIFSLILHTIDVITI